MKKEAREGSAEQRTDEAAPAGRAGSRLRRQLLDIQKKNYRRSLRLVNQSLVSSTELADYGAEYRRFLRRCEGISSKADLLKHVLSCDIVYHGDYHTLWQSQRSVLAMLQEIGERRKVVLCLEMFHGSDQRFLDQFMDGRLDEKAFLRKIGYARKWAYNWNPWREILELCRARGFRVLGINTRVDDEGTMLAERDVFSAQIVGRALLQNPGALIYVVDGDYHVCPAHLPREVEARLRPLGVEPRRTIIYQNAENLYWKLAEQGREEADVLQIASDSFCLMNTVPAGKLQSYLHWLECSEDGYLPVRGEWAELSGENYFRMVQSIVRDLDSLFRFQFPMEALERLSVYSSRQLSLLEILQEAPELKGSLRRIKAKLKRDEAFLLEYPSGGQDCYLIYLPNAGISMAAEEATHFMNVVLRGRLPYRLRGFDYFYANCLTELLGFLGSKLVNEKRKPPSESALRQYLGQVRQGALRETSREITEVARLLLQHLYLDRHGREEAAYRRKFSRVYDDCGVLPQVLSTQLGYLLGNKAYYAVKKGFLPLNEVRQLFYRQFCAPGEAFAVYRRLNRRLRRFRSPALPAVQPFALTASG